IQAAIQTSLPALNDILSNLQQFAPDSETQVANQVNQALLTAQIQSLQSIDTSGQAMITLLQSINHAVGGKPVNVPSYDVGSRFIPTNQLAYLHAGERVLTAQENASGSYGGDITVNIHDSAHPRETAQEVVRALNNRARYNTRAAVG